MRLWRGEGLSEHGFEIKMRPEVLAFLPLH
jgi:hypothetical protein